MAAALLALLLLAAAPASAPAKVEPSPPGPVEHLAKRVVEAIRNCPEPEPGEIAVCARDRGVAEGWRLPRLDPKYAGTKLRPSGRGTLASEGPGAAGTGSCTAAGAGGSTGCMLQLDNQWGAWKKEQQATGQNFPW